ANGRTSGGIISVSSAGGDVDLSHIVLLRAAAFGTGSNTGNLADGIGGTVSVKALSGNLKIQRVDASGPIGGTIMLSGLTVAHTANISGAGGDPDDTLIPDGFKEGKQATLDVSGGTGAGGTLVLNGTGAPNGSDGISFG